MSPGTGTTLSSASASKDPPPIDASRDKAPNEFAHPCLIKKYGQGAVGRFCNRCNSVVRRDGMALLGGGSDCSSHTQY
ncbi:MAG: hypothetical protein O2877_00650 [bacterium]|nr:hypothetical protein [bacterium]